LLPHSLSVSFNDLFCFPVFFSFSIYLKLGAERFRAPEILFRPSLVGSESLGISECLGSAGALS
jgi:hypothetical protein